MKKLGLKMLLVACIACGLYITHKNEKIQDLTLSNVEALANGEGGTTTSCIGSGSVECYGHYVQRKISGLSLDEE